MKKKTVKRKTEPKKLSMREKLVTNILYYAGDEYETKGDVIDLAMETEEQLVQRLIDILDYYHDKADELSFRVTL